MKYSFGIIGVDFVHGGDWESFRDYSHWQITRVAPSMLYKTIIINKAHNKAQ